MRCFVQIASIRRTLFQAEEERTTFLRSIMNGIQQILRSNIGRNTIPIILIESSGLEHQPNHHEFCRVLARLKGNYQLTHIIAVEGYEEWLSHVALFTMKSFGMWQVYLHTFAVYLILISGHQTVCIFFWPFGRGLLFR